MSSLWAWLQWKGRCCPDCGKRMQYGMETTKDFTGAEIDRYYYYCADCNKKEYTR